MKLRRLFFVLVTCVAIAQSAFAVSTTVVISEFRVRGPIGGNDEFIELLNVSSHQVAIGGWKINGSNAAVPPFTSTRLTISAGTFLDPGCHYLVTNSSTSGGPYSGGVAGSQTYGTGITDDGGIALLDAGGTIVDQVGMSSGSAYKEGTPLASLGSSNQNRGYARRSGGAQDTDNNANDFVLVSPSDPQNGCGMNVSGSANPNVVNIGDSTLLTATVAPGSNPASTAILVTGNLTPIGGLPAQGFFDDGSHGDVTPNDNIFSFSATVTSGTTAGTKSISISASDAQTRSASASILLTVQIPPPVLTIHAIQGNGSRSPYAGSAATTTGIVTAIKASTSSGGFFIQEEDTHADSDPNTSEAIFVFTGSTPLPAAVAVGNLVTVTGTVQEFIPSSDPNSPPSTEMISPSISLVTSGKPLPEPITLTSADLSSSGGIEQLEKYEHMRVHVDSLTTISPTQGNVSEANATSTSTGVFFGVITGTPRPFREAGIQDPDPIPNPPCCIPRFDANPERLRIDSDALRGTSRLDVTSNQEIHDITGVLDYSSRAYTIEPEATLVATNSPMQAILVSTAAQSDFMVASFNMERFFDTTNDPGIDDVALTTTAFNNRLAKVSLAIRNVMRSPDIIGVEEMENLPTLQAVADQLNNDAVAAGEPNPHYVPYLIEGNDVGGIDVGFLVRTPRVEVLSVIQEGKNTTYINPNNLQPELLNDRPPLILRAVIHSETNGAYRVTAIVNHLRSLSGIDDPADGNRVRTKRRAEAEFLANLIQSRQISDPAERIVSVGDYNAFDVNDGYVDVMATIKGTPTIADQVVLASSDLVNPDLTDLVLPTQYSYSFDGDAQTLDHILVNHNITGHVEIAHNDADFPEVYRNDPTRPERISDHDMPVAFFSVPVPVPSIAAPTASTYPDPFTVTVTVRDELNNVVAGYRGTISVTSTLPTTLPATYTFTEGDAGSHTFTAVPLAAGTCIVTVSNGTSASATIHIIGLRESLQSVIGSLNALRGGTNNKQDQNKLDDAIKHLTKAIDAQLWLDEIHGDPKTGDQIFNETKDAINPILLLLKDNRSSIDPRTLQSLLNRIVADDRALAATAINDAAGGDSARLAAAQSELSRGDDDIAAGRYESGLEHYRNAWAAAMKA